MPQPTGECGEAEGLTALADKGNAPTLGCTPANTWDAWDCILLATNFEPVPELGSELEQTGARVSLSGIAETGTVTMVLVGNVEGGGGGGWGAEGCGGMSVEQAEPVQGLTPKR